MELLTLQQVFNKSAIGLLTQMAKSTFLTPSGLPNCAYRGEGGKCCGVGFLITDEAYTPALENEPVCDEGVIDALEASGVHIGTDCHDEEGYRAFQLLDLIQDIHDGKEPALWADALADLAKQYDLDMPDRSEYERKELEVQP